MEIQKLDNEVIKKLRSSASMHSFTQCVTELVLNSIDSKCTAISVRVDLITMKIQVVDNGEGITKENLKVMGQRHFTSKCKSWTQLENSAVYYGFRGEALASIAECAESVSITSKFKNSNETYLKMLSKKGPEEIKVVKNRPSVGTTVTVEGFFYNLPVRRKRIVVEFELQDIKKNIESLIIIHPKISFSVRNNLTSELILQSKSSIDIIASFRLLHPNIDGEFNLVKVTKGKIKVDGLFLKELSSNKNLQYIYLNKRPIFCSKIEKLVQSLLLTNVKTKYTVQCKYPVFVLNVKCPCSRVNILLGPSKTLVEFKDWETIKKCIEKLVNSHLGKEQKPTIHRPVRTVQLNYKGEGGISQIVGAIKGCAYRRKERNANLDEEIVDETRASDSNAIALLPRDNVNQISQKREKSKQRRNKQTEHYNITESTPIVRMKTKVKKILPIKLSVNKLQKRNRKPLSKIDDENFSSVTHFTSDEKKGKDLIMDMFLKSTQAYNSEENVMETGSEETVYEEESHFLMKNNLHTNINGKKSTMSVSVNVRSKRKIRKSKTTKGIQTTFEADTINKCLQTSLMDNACENYKTTNKNIGTEHKANNYIGIINSTNNKRSVIKLTNKQKTCCCDCHLSRNKHINLSTIQEPIKLDKQLFFPQNVSFSSYDNKENRYNEKIFNYTHDKMEDNITSRIAECIYIKTRKGEKHIRGNTKSPYFNNKKTSKFHQTFDEKQKERATVETKSEFHNENIYRNQTNNFLDNINYIGTYNNFEPILFSTQNQNNQIQKNEISRFLGIKHHSLSTEDLKYYSSKKRKCAYYNDKNTENDLCQNRLGDYQNNLSSKTGFHMKLNTHTMQELADSFEDLDEGSILNITLTNTDRNFVRENYDFQMYHNAEINLRTSQKQQLYQNYKLYEHSENSNINNVDCTISSFKHKALGIPCRKYDKQQDVVNVSHYFHKKQHETNLLPTQTLRTETVQSKNNETEVIFSLDIQQKHISETNNESENKTGQNVKEINGQVWIEKFNDVGNKFYINKKTGFISADGQEYCDKTFQLEERLDFLPKGMSPIITKTKQIDISLSQNTKGKLLEYIMETYKTELLYIKWQHYMKHIEPNVFFEMFYKEKLKMLDDSIPNIANIGCKKNHLKDVVSFGKQYLKNNLFVVGQVDKKFIAAIKKVDNLLLLFDQHAVHERIRLEKLLKFYKNSHMACDDRIILFIPRLDLLLLKKYQNYCNSLGLILEFFDNGIEVTGIPICLHNKYTEIKIVENNSITQVVKFLITEIVDILKSTKGASIEKIPTLIYNVICLEACRGSIKFGDNLNNEMCGNLLQQLANCDLPFQCAHGRPTVVPLVYLTRYNKLQNEKPFIQKLKREQHN